MIILCLSKLVTINHNEEDVFRLGPLDLSLMCLTPSLVRSYVRSKPHVDICSQVCIDLYADCMLIWKT